MSARFFFSLIGRCVKQTMNDSETVSRENALYKEFDNLEQVFKASTLINLGLAENVLNEYRYLARALVDMKNNKEEKKNIEFHQALGRAEAAFSSALCDTIDNVHMYVNASLKYLRETYPYFKTSEHIDNYSALMESRRIIENVVSNTRFDRSNRKSQYLKLAVEQDFKNLVVLAQEMPKLLGLAPSSLVADPWHERILYGLENDEFVIYLQPKRNVESFSIVGAEALLRWNENKQHPISPAIFIPEAERNGTIIPLGKWVIERVISMLREWKERPELRDLVISVNVSPCQLLDVNFQDYVLNAIGSDDDLLKKIELEITEDVLISDKKSAGSQLMGIGCDIAVDDFGKGSTEFQYLADFSIHTIKIDKSIIDMLSAYAQKANEDDNQTIEYPLAPQYKKLIKGVSALGNGVGAKVVAEGVETEKVLSDIKEAGILIYQGYYNNGRPIPVSEFEKLACLSKQ